MRDTIVLNGSEFTVHQADKSQQFMKLALQGMSGSGKTYTLLMIMFGMLERAKELGHDIGNGKILVGDTEAGSSELYSDRFPPYDIIDLGDEPTVETLRDCMLHAEAERYFGFIADSGTHPWQTLSDEVQKLSKAKYGGNYWAAWSEGTPRQKEIIRLISRYRIHFGMTMRVTTEWAAVKDDRGKVRPERVGLKADQGKGIEYEFTMYGQMDGNHTMTMLKDRTGKFQDKIIEKPDEAFAVDIYDWLKTGKSPAASFDEISAIAAWISNLGYDKTEILGACSQILGKNLSSSAEITVNDFNQIRTKVDSYPKKSTTILNELEPATVA